MPRQHVLTRLARHFHVVWCDRPVEWRQAWLGRGPSAGLHRVAQPATPPGFSLYRPGPWLPRFYRPRALDHFTRARRLDVAQAMLRRRGARRFILYLWRPDFDYALDLRPGMTSCYHIDDEFTYSEEDDEYLFSPTEHPLDAREARLIRRVDEVFIHSRGLWDKKGGLNPHTTFIPNGVDYPAFAAPAPEPPDLRGIPHPRVGYVGIIKGELDIPLVAGLARRHPGWSFVLVGPSRLEGGEARELGAMAQMPNVHMLGAKAPGELAAYMQHLDVGLLPYRRIDYTEFIYPMKLHEYLASGCAVVGTPIRSLQEFGQVITLASSPDEWSRALEAAVSPAARGAEAVAKRRGVAREHDWDRLADKVAEILLKRLDQPRSTSATRTASAS
ncbi:MAG TPA: glycosyltransferase [Gemmatimonadales bacterium]|nr:glycosyltransferase [Gemmatimonadales bacterium]